MNTKLSKQDKKELRRLIDMGLVREFESALTKSDRILEKWKYREKNTRESYYNLFEHIKDFDKHIADRYDRLTPGYYVLTVANLLYQKIILEEEMVELSPEVKAIINQVLE